MQVEAISGWQCETLLQKKEETTVVECSISAISRWLTGFSFLSVNVWNTSTCEFSAMRTMNWMSDRQWE